MPREAQKRITRACDRCSKARIRCDGGTPCDCCRENGRDCQYTRLHRKRGPKPRSSLIAKVSKDEFREAGDSDTPLDRPDAISELQSTFSASPASPGVAGVDRSITRADSQNIKPLRQSTSSCLTVNLEGSEELRTPSRSSHYPCLELLNPHIADLLDLNCASALLRYYFVQPNPSLFTSASPYILTPVIRQSCLLNHEQPRATSETLLLTILWVSAHTAHIPFLLLPRRRKDVCDKLGRIVISRIHKCEQATVDNLLSLVLFAIVSTGSNNKADSIIWWYQVVDMCERMRLSSLDTVTPSSSLIDTFASQAQCQHFDAEEEAQEEKRRLFWLVFALDRHWALSFNRMPLLLESDCQVFLPCPDALWDSTERYVDLSSIRRQYGPLLEITGPSFFEFFVPLMAILGDVIWIHHQYCNSRLGSYLNADAVRQTDCLLNNCFEAVRSWQSDSTDITSNPSPSRNHGSNLLDDLRPIPTSSMLSMTVKLYAEFILHTLFVLLHGRWDALDLISPHDESIPEKRTSENPVLSSLSDWITSTDFQTCCTHAVAASEVVSKILDHDPELAFMPYLFGIYLLHSSFILLFFADRMPVVGDQPNESVEEACERTIRAHEVCVATLNVEFQKDFRKVLRRTLFNVRQKRSIGQSDQAMRDFGHDDGQNLSSSDNAEAISRSVLGMYRWTKGHRGLAV